MNQLNCYYPKMQVVGVYLLNCQSTFSVTEDWIQYNWPRRLQHQRALNLSRVLWSKATQGPILIYYIQVFQSPGHLKWLKMLKCQVFCTEIFCKHHQRYTPTFCTRAVSLVIALFNLRTLSKFRLLICPFIKGKGESQNSDKQCIQGSAYKVNLTLSSLNFALQEERKTSRAMELEHAGFCLYCNLLSSNCWMHSICTQLQNKF
jgi:hypothetical protein